MNVTYTSIKRQNKLGEEGQFSFGYIGSEMPQGSFM